MKFQRKPTKSGRLLTSLITRQLVWDFWHANSQEWTNTTEVAKLRVLDKSRIQSGLDYYHNSAEKKTFLSKYSQNHGFMVGRTSGLP